MLHNFNTICIIYRPKMNVVSNKILNNSFLGYLVVIIPLILSPLIGQNAMIVDEDAVLPPGRVEPSSYPQSVTRLQR